MAGIFDDMIQPGSTDLAGADAHFIDADTLEHKTKLGSNGKPLKYRLQGINAPEVIHSGKDGIQSGTQEAGAQMTTEQVIKLANSMGYTNIVEDGDQGEDKYGRIVADLQDSKGRSFKRALSTHGITEVIPAFDKSGLEFSNKFQKALKTKEGYEETEWDKAANMIENAWRQEEGHEKQFKQRQLFSGQLDESGVAHKFATDTADFEYTDRDVRSGDANNPTSTAWNTGLIGVTEATYGIVNLLGEKIGSETLEVIGEAGINRARTRIADQGRILTDYKDVDGFGDAIEYLTNNAALSLPYMGISIGGALAAPFTGGLSLAAPAAVYAGQSWNEAGEINKENRSASIAVASGVVQAALDRLGIGLIFKAGVAPKELYKKGVAELVRRGATETAAKATVAAATRKEIAGFAGDAAKVAAEQLKAKAIVLDLFKRGAIGGVGEGVTEALQETVAYTGAHLAADGGMESFNWVDLKDRAIQAAVAGSALGTGFSVPGGLYNTGAWADVAVRQAPADAKRLSEQGRYAEEEINAHGRVKSIEELTAEARSNAASPNLNTSLDQRIDADKTKRKARTFNETVAETLLSAPALWRGSTRWIFGQEVQSQSRAARVLADMFGANLQKTFSGSTYENAKHHRVSVYKNMVAFPQKAWGALNGGKRPNKQRKAELSDQVYNTIRGATDKNGKFDPRKIPADAPNRQLIIDLQAQMESLSNKMWTDQKKYNPALGKINNYLARYKSFNKQAIHKDRGRFKDLLRSEMNLSDSEATAITNSLLDSTEVNDFGEAYSVTKGPGVSPGSHQKRTLNLSENDAFNDFFEKDIFANMSNAAKSAARYVTHNEYVGPNGQNVAQLLQEMENEGVAPEKVNRIAAQMKDYLDAESGNYKRPSTEAGRTFQTVQRSFMAFTTLAGLPLATISSFVELALSAKGLTLDQIMGKKGSLSTLGKELGDSLWSGMKEVGAIGTRENVGVSDSKGKQRLRELGYYDWDVGAATTTGVTETNTWQQPIYENFFKWTGLQGWTNYTRSIRAAIAGDHIMDHMEKILSHDGPMTNEIQESREQLRNLGINVDDLAEVLTRAPLGFSQTDATFLENTFREATFNFVNEAVALPQAANRPLIYQDPRFALFTQFQGFIATFTANHIPKLWGEYVKRGTPAMKYNAFAVMTTMIMLGFASQYLKDLIKYGPEGNPYLDDPQLLQRGVRASGLLGTGERVLDQFFPLYEDSSKDLGTWVFNTSVGESPALGNLKRLGKASGNLLEGDVGKFAKNLGKSFPVSGPFSSVNEWIGEKASGWNFKGE